MHEDSSISNKCAQSGISMEETQSNYWYIKLKFCFYDTYLLTDTDVLLTPCVIAYLQFTFQKQGNEMFSDSL